MAYSALAYPGIDPTGNTDSTAALKTLIVANRHVVLPAGKYKTSLAGGLPIILPDHCTLAGPLRNRGEAAGQTGFGAVIINNDNVDTIQLAGGSLATLASVVDGLSFEGTGTGAHINSPVAAGTNNMAIRHCYFSGKTNGIALRGTVYDIFIEDCFFYNQSGTELLITNSSATGGTGIHIRDCYFSTGTLYGIQIAGTTSLTDLSIVGCTFAGFVSGTVYHIYTQANVTRALILDNHFEGPNAAGSYGLFVTQGQGWTILSNQPTNMPNGFSLALFSDSIIGGNRFSSMSGNSIVIPNDGSVRNWILPNADASTGGISDLSGGTVQMVSTGSGGLKIPVSAVGPGGAGINLGSGGGPAVANPRIIFYDDLSSASYVSEDISGGLHVRATSQMFLDIVPTGATRFTANNPPTISFTATTLGFFGKTPAVQQATAATATDLASVITLANALKTALTNLGLTT